MFAGGVQKAKIADRRHKLHHFCNGIHRPVKGNFIAYLRPFFYGDNGPGMFAPNDHKTYFIKHFVIHGRFLLQLGQIAMTQFESNINGQITHNDKANMVILIT